eukprot:7507955-Prorocentrum_lima.AAC.1
MVPSLDSGIKTKDLTATMSERMISRRSSAKDAGASKITKAQSRATSAGELGPLEVTLSETPTQTLLEIPSIWQASDSQSAAAL